MKVILKSIGLATLIVIVASLQLVWAMPDNLFADDELMFWLAVLVTVLYGLLIALLVNLFKE